MDLRVVNVRGDPPDTEVLASVARHLEADGIVAMPTETVYGISALVRDESIRRVQALKSRGEDQPFLVLVQGFESVAELVWTHVARELAEVFWPGAVTLVLRDPSCRFPPGVRSREGTVAVRQSPHPLVRGLLKAVGGPLISTSLNPPGEPPALSAQEAGETILNLGATAPVWVLDGGRLPPSEPSTIIDCAEAQPRILRAGSVPLKRIRCVLPGLEGLP